MKIKNISGAVGFFTLAGRSRELAANEELVIPDTLENFNDAHKLQMQGLLTIVESPSLVGQIALASRPVSAFIKITGAVANGDSVTINGTVFKWAASAAALAAGEYYAGVGAAEATAAGTLASAIAAALADTGIRCAHTTMGTNEVIHLALESLTLPREPLGVEGSDFTLAKSGANIAVSGATFEDGEEGRAGRLCTTDYDVTAADVTNAGAAIATPFRSCRLVSFMILRSDALLTTWDGTVEAADGFVVLYDSGAVNLEEDDKVVALVQERFSVADAG